MTNQWERIHELWELQQRGELPKKEFTTKELHYYKLIKQLEAVS